MDDEERVPPATNELCPACLGSLGRSTVSIYVAGTDDKETISLDTGCWAKAGMPKWWTGRPSQMNLPPGRKSR